MSRNPVPKIIFAAILLGLLIFFSRTDFFAGTFGKATLALKPIAEAASRLRLGLSGDSELAGENQRLIAENFELEALREENRSFRKALDFKEEKKIPLRGARVMYYGQEVGREFIIADQGLGAGIKKGDLAVDGNGFFVGIVESSREDTSRVDIGSNPGRTFEIDIIPSGTHALAKGIGGRAFSIELLPVDAAIAKGDFISLFGIGRSGARFSAALGEIANIKKGGGSAFNEARAIILARPEALREVYIIESRLP